MFKNRSFMLRNVEICAVPSWKDLDLLILRNRGLRLRYIHIWDVPPCYVVDLMLLRNLFFRLRNVQIWVVLSCKVDVLLISQFCFEAAISSDMNCVEVQVGLFDDRQEWHFQVRIIQISAGPSSKGTIGSSLGKAFSRCETLIMECAVQQWNWIADAQGSRFQGPKRTEMCSTIMKGLVFFW